MVQRSGCGKPLANRVFLSQLSESARGINGSPQAIGAQLIKISLIIDEPGAQGADKTLRVAVVNILSSRSGQNTTIGIVIKVRAEAKRGAQGY